MRRIESFYASRFERQLSPNQTGFLKTIHEWIPKLVEERRKGDLRRKLDDGPFLKDFFSGPPTIEHGRILTRAILENGFVRLARHTGKVYELGDLMPDKAAIKNYLDKWYLETMEEFHERSGSFPYFCAIVSSFAERTITWVLLGRPSINLEGEAAKLQFCENWKGKPVRRDMISYHVKHWTLFLVFYLFYSNNPEIPRDRRLVEMILHSLVTIGGLQIME